MCYKRASVGGGFKPYVSAQRWLEQTLLIVTRQRAGGRGWAVANKLVGGCSQHTIVSEVRPCNAAVMVWANGASIKRITISS